MYFLALCSLTCAKRLAVDQDLLINKLDRMDLGTRNWIVFKAFYLIASKLLALAKKPVIRGVAEFSIPTISEQEVLEIIKSLPSNVATGQRNVQKSLLQSCCFCL